MAPLTSSLLNLASFVSGLSELAPVKKHVFRAGREVLLAIEELLEFVEQYVGESGLSVGKAVPPQTIQNVIDFAQKSIHKLAKQLPKGDEEEYKLLHRKVMSSILEVLDMEIHKNSRRKNQKAKMKVEVFEAIRKVLLREIHPS